jgi:hypothetical protein
VRHVRNRRQNELAVTQQLVLSLQVFPESNDAQK